MGKLNKGEIMKQHIRQGEVFLQRVKEFPKTTKKVKTFIVAHSESGHNHVLESDQKFDVAIDKAFTYIRLTNEATLTHQKTYDQHNDLKVEPGVYKVIHKKEYNPFEKIMTEVWD